jgi:hypothetical protein
MKKQLDVLSWRVKACLARYLILSFDGAPFINIAEVPTAEGKLYLFVAVDRTSKSAFVQLVEKQAA